MASPTPTITIDIIRHAEALHNILGSHIRDPPLTAAGRAQCRQLARAFPEQYAPAHRVTHVVASPLRRTIETALEVFEKSVFLGVPDVDVEDQEASTPPKENSAKTTTPRRTARTSPTKAKTTKAAKTKKRKPKAMKKLILLPELQEASPYPSSTGSSPEALQVAYGDGDDAVIDWASLSDDPLWYRKGPDTPFAPDAAKVEARARKARVWLRKLARRTVASGAATASGAAGPANEATTATTTDGGDDNDDDDDDDDDDDGLHIVVVTHGEFVHWLTGDFAGVGKRHNTGWWNAECRSFQFADLEGQSDDDEEATLVETARSRERRRGFSFQPLGSAAEKALAKEIAVMRLRAYAKDVEMGLVGVVDGEGKVVEGEVKGVGVGEGRAKGEGKGEEDEEDEEGEEDEEDEEDEEEWEDV